MNILVLGTAFIFGVLGVGNLIAACVAKFGSGIGVLVMLVLMGLAVALFVMGDFNIRENALLQEQVKSFLVAPPVWLVFAMGVFDGCMLPISYLGFRKMEVKI